jgi:hypothetical protein
MSFSHSKQTWAEQTNLDIAIAHCLSEVSPHTFRKATFFLTQYAWRMLFLTIDFLMKYENFWQIFP